MRKWLKVCGEEVDVLVPTCNPSTKKAERLPQVLG